ncbi:MAG TPA: SGNH/GDSL hydrolase family protein [Polyangiales bacterium]
MTALVLSACARGNQDETIPIGTDAALAAHGADSPHLGDPPHASSGAGPTSDGSALDVADRFEAGAAPADARAEPADAGPAHDAAEDAADAANGADAALDAGGVCTRGAINARQVVMIGDSFFHITEIPQVLWSKARAAGSLGPDETYRHYYLSGAMVASDGLVAPIPTQWDDALAEGRDIRVVIFNGGGNDVLVGDRTCLTQAPPENAGCTMTIENVRKTVRALMDRMAKDGVQQVVYATYPHMPTWGLFQGDAPAINQTIDYSEEIARKECESSRAPKCVFVSTKAAFEGHPEYLNPLDVHASPEGSKVAGALIWQAMVDHCIAQ